MVGGSFGVSVMSPGQRKPGKKIFNIWFTQAEKEHLARVAEAYGLDMTALIKLAVKKAAEKKGIR